MVVLRLLLGAATCYALIDAVEEYSLYETCRSFTDAAAKSNEALKEEIGETLGVGALAYFDSSLKTTHRGNVVHCTIPVHGERGASDVQIKLVKTGDTAPVGERFFPQWLSGGFGWIGRDYSCPGGNLVYNHLGPGEWKVLLHYAVIGGAGALPRHISLEEPEAGREGRGSPGE